MENNSPFSSLLRLDIYFFALTIRIAGTYFKDAKYAEMCFVSTLLCDYPQRCNIQPDASKV
jgi:hypothetical protein